MDENNVKGGNKDNQRQNQKHHITFDPKRIQKTAISVDPVKNPQISPDGFCNRLTERCNLFWG